jgi:ABC-type branched-subunit amino acid transport system ATPase component
MPILETIQLSRSFGELLAVDSVSFTVDPGEVFGLPLGIGSN